MLDSAPLSQFSGQKLLILQDKRIILHSSKSAKLAICPVNRGLEQSVVDLVCIVDSKRITGQFPVCAMYMVRTYMGMHLSNSSWLCVFVVFVLYVAMSLGNE